MIDAASRSLARDGGANAADRVSPQPRPNWISRLVKAVADFLRRRRFARNRALLRPPGRGAKG